jgi:hypothetical protein
MEVGRRLGVPIVASVCRVTSSCSATVSTPTRSTAAASYTADELEPAWQRITGLTMPLDRRMLQPTHTRSILLRMLNNLKNTLVAMDEPGRCRRSLGCAVPSPSWRTSEQSTRAGCDTGTDDRPDPQAFPRTDDARRAGRGRPPRRGVSRAYCSHWVSQVSFEEPIVMASVSPKHDTHPLMAASGAVRRQRAGRRPGGRRAVLLVPGPQVPVPGRRVPHVFPGTRAAGGAATPSRGCAARCSRSSRWPTTSCSSLAWSRCSPAA